jgi:heme exporter protein B
MKAYLDGIRAIIWKDLKSEWRTRESLTAMLVFALLVVLIFNFTLELEVQAWEYLTPGVLWVTFIFAGTIGLNRSMAAEKDRGCLDGLLLAPLDRSVIYFGKLISNLVITLLVEVIVLPFYGFLFQVNLFRPGFLLVMLLGTFGYVAVGTLLAAMVIQVRTRDILLPILLFPLTLPVVIPAVKASQGLLGQLPLGEISSWLNLLIVFDLIFSAVSWMFFDYVVEE